MKIVNNVKKMSHLSVGYRRRGRTIGFVPTMGYLHRGHLSLIRRARKDCDAVVVSIYVNPTQFGPKEDFKKYPRDLKRDLSLCRKEGVDIAFIPDDKQMYPQGSVTHVDVKVLDSPERRW